MTRSTSAAGRAAITQREGCRLQAYLDSVGVPTIGVGHTGRASPPAVGMGMSITEAEADAYLATDLAPMETAVDDAVKAKITQNQFDACVSLAFNIGAHGFIGSTVVHRLNAGDPAGAADAFLMWERPPELRQRRNRERAQFLTPDPGSVPIEIPRPIAALRRPPEPASQARDPGLLRPHLLPKPSPGLWARIAGYLTRKAA